MSFLTAHRGVMGTVSDAVCAQMTMTQGAIARRLRYKRTYAALCALSDRELKDLGLERDTLGRVARQAANDAG